MRIWYGRDQGDRYYFVVYVALSFGNILLKSLNGDFLFPQIVSQSSDELHYRLARTVFFATPKHLNQIDAGNLLNRFRQDVPTISRLLPLRLLEFAYIFTSLLVEIGIIASGSRYTAQMTVFLTSAIYVIQHFYLCISRQLRSMELESRIVLANHVTETANGMQHIRSFGWQQRFMDEFSQFLERTQRPCYVLFCCRR